MRTHTAAFLVLLASLAIPTAGARADAAEAPVVVELFTSSQSCSSCPAADRALRALARENSQVLALSCHVTYWNHLHWKDTLSRPECTERQRAYSASLGTGRGVYTPQMVVNGEVGFVGSRSGEARAAVAKARDLRPIALSRGPDGALRARVPELPRAAYSLRTFGYKRNHLEDVRSGENRGRKLQYTNSVTYVAPPHRWDGRALEQRVALPAGRIEGVTVVAQANDTGRILAAGNLLIP